MRSSLAIALLSALVLTGCASNRHLQVAEHVTRDTVYLRDVSVEYRYTLLRDTIYKTRIDSIPYEVRVVETHEVRHIPLYAKLLSWIGTLALLLLLARLLLLLLSPSLYLSVFVKQKAHRNLFR